MPTHVYANGREICSKAADGKSAAAFPDVCWSPPGPPAGPVPLPYPNTAFAKDLANGTATVFICGTPVARKDESYLETSVGNEPATTQFPKGINTGALKGKAYFTSWSMNVMVEGLNVPRHQDLMTHNHASPGGQTPPNKYRDNALSKFPEKCSEEREAIDRECGPEPQESKREKDVRRARKGFLKKVSDRLSKLQADKGAKGSPGKSWMEHCDGLWVKPTLGYNKEMEEFAKQIGDIKGELESVASSVIKPALESLKRELPGMAMDALGEGALALGKRLLVRWGVGLAGAAVGGVGAVATEAVATGANIYDAGNTIVEGYRFSKQALASFNELKDVVGAFDAAVEGMEKARQAAASDPAGAMAEVMNVLARLNKCTRARRCFLPDYEDTETSKTMAGKGCCPGQTGHHILPHAMTKGGQCPGYKKKKAPTVCVEGVSWSHGSHGSMHEALGRRIASYKVERKKDTISYEDARDMGVDSVRAVFPESACSEACLKAQLDKYYEKKCKKEMPAVSGSPKDYEPEEMEPGADD